MPKVFSAGTKESQIGTRPQITQARKEIAREEYNEVRRRQKLAKIDPIGGLRQELSQLEKLLQGNGENPFMTARFQALIEAKKESIATLERNQQEVESLNRELALLDKAQENELREVALLRGPLFRQRLLWLLGDMWRPIAKTGRKIQDFISEINFAGFFLWPVRHNRGIYLTTWFLSLISITIFSAWFSFGKNWILSALTLIILFLFSVDWGGPDPKLGDKPIMNFILCALLIAYSCLTISYKTWSPMDGWALVTRQGNEIVQITDSRDTFMRAPRIWKGEGVEWIDLTTPGHKDFLNNARKNTETTIGNFQGRQIVLIVEYQIATIREGIPKMIRDKRQPAYYLDDIERQIKETIKNFNLLSAATAQAQTEQALKNIRNELYEINSLTLILQIRQ